ncbi:MAG: hypothetical protein AAFX50_17530, partial [Acidobacteriota bacterium]
LMATLRRPLLWMVWTALGVASAYSAQTMVHPYDLPALLFAALAVTRAESGRFKGFAALLAVGTGFKETVALFALLVFAADASRRARLRRFVVTCGLCGAVMLGIDAFSGRAPLALEAISNEDVPKVVTNFDTLQEMGFRFLLANAGLGLLIFVLPARRRFDRVAKATTACFLVGLYLFAGIAEWRTWFELLPLNLAVLGATLDHLRASRRAGSEAGLGSRLRRWGDRWPGRLGLIAAALAAGYLVAALLVLSWTEHYSRHRLSRTSEVRAYFDKASERGLYQYHPRRQFTLRPGHRGWRHGFEEWPMQTDARGLAFLPPNSGRLDLLVLGDSVAFGFGLPYERSVPGLLKLATDARVFSGATESYSLEQTVDLFEEVGGEWDAVLFVWTPNDFVTARFRELPGSVEERGASMPPPDLLAPNRFFWRVTDHLTPRPPGLTRAEVPAWNPRRYPEHLELLRRLNRGGDLIVVLSYVRAQVESGDRSPQLRLKA